MQRYEITGMSCAACASHVEKAVAAVPGVASVAVSLLTNSMQVDYAPDADPDATARRILRAVDAAGYGASLASAESESAELEDTETPKLKKRLIASLCFLVPLMYVSMGHMIGLPLGSVFHGGGWHAILYAGTQLVLTLPVCWINRAFFISGWKGIKTRAPGMDTLVALGAGASLAYGVFAIVMICIGLSTGNDDLVMQYRHDLYFESAAMILTLITVGKTLEAYSKGKTTDALKSLMKLAPQTACVLRGGEQVTVPVSEVNVGDLFLVRPGESIPVDGIVTEGISTVNEAALTGESMPVDKFPGSCQRRHHQPERRPDLPGRACWPGHHPVPGHPPGAGRRRYQGPVGQDRGQGFRHLRAHRHLYRRGYVCHLAAAGPDLHLRAGPRYQCAGHQLPLRAGPGNACCHHGWQRCGRQKWHPVQDRRQPRNHRLHRRRAAG